MLSRHFLLFAFVCLGLLLAGIPGAVPSERRAQAQFQPRIGIQREPHLVVDKDNNLLLVMAAGTPGAAGRPGSQILFTESADGGANWDNMPLTRNLSNSRINGLGALFPRIAVTKTGKSQAYVVYDDDTAGPRQAYSVRSKKNANFKRPTLLSSGGGGGFAPVVAVDSSGAVNIAWAESTNGPRQVVFIRSTDQGLTFSQPVNVSRSAGEGFDPAIAIGDDDSVNIAWEDTQSGTGELFFTRSTDSGASFSSPKKISAGLGEASDPEIAIDRQSRTSVAWVEAQPEGGTRIMISRTADGGQAFSAPVVVTSGPEAEFEYIAMVTRGNAIYLAFTDDDAEQVFLTQSQGDGLRFSPPLQLSHADTSKGHAKSPSIAVDGNGRIHAVWIDTSILGGEQGLVVYRRSSDGQSFTTPVLILAAVQ
jgi:hypothetical protein